MPWSPSRCGWWKRWWHRAPRPPDRPCAAAFSRPLRPPGAGDLARRRGDPQGAGESQRCASATRCCCRARWRRSATWATTRTSSSCRRPAARRDGWRRRRWRWVRWRSMIVLVAGGFYPDPRRGLHRRGRRRALRRPDDGRGLPLHRVAGDLPGSGHSAGGRRHGDERRRRPAGGSVVTQVAETYGPYAFIASLVVLSSLLSQGLDGAPTVVILAPVVLRTAENLGISPYPLLMAVGLPRRPRS